jgi:hypothetical protein
MTQALGEGWEPGAFNKALETWSWRRLT